MVNTVEDRLRDAVQAAARTVTPAALQGLERRIAGHTGAAPLARSRARRRIVVPLTAAATITVIAVLAATLAGQAQHDRHQQRAHLRGVADLGNRRGAVGPDAALRTGRATALQGGLKHFFNRNLYLAW
jgi:hypothetical protein